MRLLSSLGLAAIVAGAAAHADSTEVQRGPAPQWAVQSEAMPLPADATGAVFIRRQDSEVHLDEKGQFAYNAYRIKILHPNALNLGNLSIVWNPAAGAPVVHVIRIYRGSEVIDVLQKAAFEVLRREDQLEAARLDGNLTAVLRIPDLRVGDELEFGATIRTSDPTLGKNDAGLLALASEPAPGRFHLRLSWEVGLKPTVRMSKDMAAVAQPGANAIDIGSITRRRSPRPRMRRRVICGSAWSNIAALQTGQAYRAALPRRSPPPRSSRRIRRSSKRRHASQRRIPSRSKGRAPR